MPDTHKKILSLNEIEAKANELRGEGKCLVLCHGTFDLLHAGHIRYLQSASKKGDVLFVTVTADLYVNKGPGRPVFPEQLRAENLAALACVDYVAINPAVTSENVIQKIQPKMYVKGSDYKNVADDLTQNILREKKAVEDVGGELIFSDEIKFSSSSLLNEHFGVFNEGTRGYLQGISQQFGSEKIIDSFSKMKPLKVLVVGDTIIDEYHYSTQMGQTAKGSHLAVRYNSKEIFAGGALAVANHIADFTESVTLVTGLGKENNYEDFIRSKLLKNIKPNFHYFDDAPTVVKRRYVDGDLNKLFEVYFYKENPSLKTLEPEVCSWLEAHAGDYDLVMVPDFGNGFISKAMIEKLCAHSQFLSVNTQVNSGNRGYHAINRYSRADFISLNGPELRMATHSRHDPLEVLAEKIAKETQAKYFAVTLGSKGAIMLDRESNAVHQAPILSTKVLDRIGAGDTFLALAGLCLGSRLPSEMTLFIASAAAALDVQIICNREPVSSVSLLKYIGTLLK